MDKETIREINPGKIALWIERGTWYYNKVSMTVTMFGVLKVLGLTWLELAVLIIATPIILVIVVYFDMRYVYPKILEYSWKKNPMVKILMEKK